jgi:hypothetical protein
MGQRGRGRRLAQRADGGPDAIAWFGRPPVISGSGTPQLLIQQGIVFPFFLRQMDRSTHFDVSLNRAGASDFRFLKSAIPKGPYFGAPSSRRSGGMVALPVCFSAMA